MLKWIRSNPRAACLFAILTFFAGIGIAQTPGVPQLNYDFNYLYGAGTEDVQHTSGDHGVVLLGVQNANLSQTYNGTTNDYTPVAVSGAGAVLVGGGAATDEVAVGRPVPVAATAAADGALASVSAAGDAHALRSDLQGRLEVRTDHPNRFACTVVNSTATTLTALGGSCAAPGAGLSLYITDVLASASVVSTTAADSFPELKSGTGGTCGTATAVVWATYSPAFDAVVQQFAQPLKVAANSELCWMHAIAGNKTFIVSGYIAP